MNEQVNEYEMLKAQLDKLNRSPSPALVDAVALWGSRLHRSTQELAAKLERQLVWLDANTCSKSFTKREDEWIDALHQYERSCHLLNVAEGVL